MALLENSEINTDPGEQSMAEEQLDESKLEEHRSDGDVDDHKEMECGEDDDDDDEALELESNCEDHVKKPKAKKLVPGILYLGHIPPRLRPKHVRNMLSLYGEIGRIFLQPEERCVKRKKKKAGSNSSSFTEGWVEFRDKRVAKRVALSLHNTPMTNKKRSPFSSDLWCLKYLHRFQWCHLSERLAYEQTVYHQRMRAEISQAKKETNFFLASVDKSQNMEKRRKKSEKNGEAVEEKTWNFKQNLTEDEIQMKKKSTARKAEEKSRNVQEKAQSNISLLAKIFSSGKAHD